MPRRKLINKVAHKKYHGKCYFCPVDDYECLNNHRIVPEEQGGEYTPFNTVVVCANCHNKIHHGEPRQIVIDRKYLSTSGIWILHYFENGEEKWL